MKQLQLETATAILLQAGVVLPQRQPGDDHAHLQAILDALCDLTSTDPLTGALNRRAFVPVLERELDRVARSGGFGLLLGVDIDHFKRVNDTYGHLVGDSVIREVAHALGTSLRPMDTLARMGGEEFCIVFPNCPPAFAAVVAQRVRVAVENARIAVRDGPPIQVTVSCGGAFVYPGIQTSVLDWLQRADDQVYRAKADGRNCVRLEDVPTTGVSADEKGLLFGWGNSNFEMDGDTQAE